MTRMKNGICAALTAIAVVMTSSVASAQTAFDLETFIEDAGVTTNLETAASAMAPVLVTIGLIILAFGAVWMAIRWSKRAMK